MNERAATGVWYSPRERVERVREATKLIRMCWESRDYFHFKGKYFDSFFYLYDKPKKPIPIYCAANGRRMLKIAGELCDGFISVGMTPQQYRDQLIPIFEDAAKKAGRDPSKMDKIAWISTFYHPDIKKALEAARRYGGLLIPECYHKIYDPRVIERRSSEVSDDMFFKAFNIASNPDDLIDRFEDYIKAGVNYIVWADGSPDGMLTPKICGEKVIPYFKEQYPEN